MMRSKLIINNIKKKNKKANDKRFKSINECSNFLKKLNFINLLNMNPFKIVIITNEKKIEQKIG